jgi:uncharacterized protein (TIGR03083 family)
MHMTLSRDAVTTGMIAEYQAFAELVRSVSDSEWQRPTRCEGWRVADVAAHVAGILDDVVHLRLDGIGTPEATQRQVDERRSFGPAELADELEQNTKLGIDVANGFDDDSWNGPAPAGLVHTVGWGVEGLWYDTFVHGDDIRAALGRQSVRPPASLNGAVSHVAQLLEDRGWGPATLALDGVDEFPVGGGGGRRITGDPLEFVLAATGRLDPARIGLDETVNVYRP